MARPTKQATPLTPALLKRLRALINDRNKEDVVIFTLCLVGFYLFLRASNLVPSSRTEFNPNKQFTRQDFRIKGDAIVVDIKWSKTVQHMQKLLQVPLLPVADPDICPVTWVHKMMTLVPAGPLDPAFCLRVKGEMLPISYSQLYDQLQKWSARLNLRPWALTPHAMRRGGASYAARVDLPGWAIALIGDWASSAYESYIDWSLKKKYSALKVMADKAPQCAQSNSDSSHTLFLQAGAAGPRRHGRGRSRTNRVVATKARTALGTRVINSRGQLL